MIESASAEVTEDRALTAAGTCPPPPRRTRFEVYRAVVSNGPNWDTLCFFAFFGVFMFQVIPTPQRFTGNTVYFQPGV